MTNVEIQPGEYADLMPDMSEEEYDALKASIERDGLRHPIEVTPEGVIVDGHHRYRACQELGVEPAFVTVEAATVEQAIRANFTRRNLNDGTKREVVETYLETHWDGETPQKEVAEALGVSEATVTNAKQNVESNLPSKSFSTEEKRQQVGEYLDRNPDASNREVARSVDADVSHATVGNWRAEWADDAAAEEADDDPEPEAVESDDAAEEEADDDPEPTEPLDDDDGGDDENRRLGKALDRIAELEAQLEEAEAENERPHEQDGGDASVKVLRRKLAQKNRRINELDGRVGELEAAIRRFLRAVGNEDPEAIREAADEAEAFVDG